MTKLIGKTVEMLDTDRKTVIGRAVIRAADDFGMGSAVEIEWRAGYVETTTAAGVRASIRRGHLRVAS